MSRDIGLYLQDICDCIYSLSLDEKAAYDYLVSLNLK